MPVSGGRNSRLALRLAADLASGEGQTAELTLACVVSHQPMNGDRVRAQQVLDYVSEGMAYPKLVTMLIEGDDTAGAILEHSAESDLVVLGATQEPLLRNFLVGTLPEKIARRSNASVMVVKRRSNRLYSAIRQTILEPTKPRPLD